MRDPYTVLGVPKTAEAADIKKAFRKLAKKYHPDQSTEPKAKDKFAEVSAAYEIIGDEKKRAAFDRGEIDAEGKPRFQGFEGFGAGGPGASGFGRQAPGGGFEHFEFHPGGGRGGGGGFDASDLFADLFGNAARRGGGGQARAPQKGADAAATVTISLAEAAHGTTARVELPTGRTLDVKVPAGMEDGKQIRLKGQGYASPLGGESGDAMVTVAIAKHPYFKVDGRDLRLDLPVTLYEAVLGAKVNVPTLDGVVELAVPAGTNGGGRTLRLRGKGLPNAQGGSGDLYVTLRIVLPDAPDAELTALMRKWEAEKRYDPRKDLTT